MPRRKLNADLSAESYAEAAASAVAARYRALLVEKVNAITAEILGQVNTLPALKAAKVLGAAPAPAKARGGPRVKFKRNMDCRVAGCKNRSGGPAKGYMCFEHEKLPKREQAAAREEWNKNHKAIKPA